MVPSIMSVADAAATLYNFTIDEQSYKETFACLRETKEVDFHEVHSELIFLTVVVVDVVLRSERIHKIHGEKAEEIFSAYLNCFKEQTSAAGADQVFLTLLNDRGAIYNKILENTDGPPELQLLELTTAIVTKCGGSSGEFHLAALREFGSLMETVGKFLETVHLN